MYLLPPHVLSVVSIFVMYIVFYKPCRQAIVKQSNLPCSPRVPHLPRTLSFYRVMLVALGQKPKTTKKKIFLMSDPNANPSLYHVSSFQQIT